MAVPTSHTEQPTHCSKTVNQKKKKKLLFESSYGENISIIYLKYKNFESIGTLTAENSYKQLEANYFYIDTALLKHVVLPSQWEKYNSTAYYLKAFFHGKKSHGSQLLPTRIFRHGKCTS